MRVLYILICALLIAALPASAQSNLTAGMTVTGQSGANYQLTASAGDLILLQAYGISSNFTPVLTLTNPTGQQVAEAQSDPLTPGTTTLAYRIPADGTYTLAVSGLYGASGQFVLTLNGSPVSAAQPLATGVNSLQIGSTAQVYQFTGPAALTISADSLVFSAEVRDGNGQIVSELDGVPQGAFAIDSSGTFDLTLDSASGGQVNVLYTPRPDLAITEQATEAATEQAVPETATLIAPSATPSPTALPPTVTPTPSNTPLPTATLVPTATLAPTATPSPSATFTSTPIPATTEPAIATITPPATAQTENVQIAPRDGSYQVTITLGNAFTSSDVVSYPKGDQEDTIFYTISGLSRDATSDSGKARLQITALCNGTGTEFISIAVGKQTYHCGDIIADTTVTYATRSGSIRIAATGGSATYVQWELIGSATPIR